MKTVVKFLMISSGLVLMGIGIGGIVVFARTQTSKTALERALTAAFGSETRIESVAFAPLERSLILYGLKIENPPDFLPGTAIEAGRTEIQFDLPSLFTDTPTIPRISIEDAVFNMQHALGEGANLLALARGSDDPARPDMTGSGRRFSVEQVEVNGAKLALSSNLAPDAEVRMDVAPVAVADPVETGPATAGEAGRAILAEILARTISPEGLLTPMADRVRERIEEIQDSLAVE